MNWLTNFVRPKIRQLVRKKEVPEALWKKCTNCGQMIFHRDLDANLYVCPHCDCHLRIGPQTRFAQLFDDGAHQRIELPEVVADPLKFRDSKRYPERIKESRARTGEEEAVVVAHGSLGGNAIVIAVQNFAFMGGSMGLAAGEAIIAAARLAVLQQAALIVFAAAGGARMQEGVLSLMQMPRTTIAVNEVRAAGLPYIVVLTDPTTGGVAASYAMLGDVAIAEPRALIGFAGPRVIENTIRQKLPEGFQRAEFLLAHGMIDMVVHRRDLRSVLLKLVDLLRNPKARAEVVALPKAASGAPAGEAALADGASPSPAESQNREQGPED